MLADTSFRYFYEVARAGSIRQAADNLHVSPSAISRMIAKIEHRFRVPVFERRTDGMRLTAAGKILADQLSGIYAQIQDAETRISELQGIRRGKVSLYCIEAVMLELAPSFLTEFHQRYPDITFSVKLGSTEDIVASLLSYQSDIGITFNMPPQDGIEALKKFEYPLHVLVAPSHELARRRQTTLREVANYRLVMPESTFGVRQIVDLAMREHGITIDMFMTTNSLAFARSMARQGAAVTLSSKFAARSELAAKQLVAIPIAESRLLTGVTTVCKHAQRPLSASAAELFNYIEKSFPEREVTRPG